MNVLHGVVALMVTRCLAECMHDVLMEGVGVAFVIFLDIVYCICKVEYIWIYTINISWITLSVLVYNRILYDI